MLIPLILVSLVIYTDKNQITGAIIYQPGTLAQLESDSNIIGAYSIAPSFKAKVNYNLEDEYQKISKKLDELIDKCKNTADIEKCLRDNSKEWSCLELKDEASAILYDFIDKFNECMNIKEDGVVCRFSLDEREIINRPIKSFNIVLTNEGLKTRVEIKERTNVWQDYINLENLAYTNYDYRDTLNERLNPVTINVEFEGKKPVIKDVFGKDDSSNGIPLSKTFLLYRKNNQTKFVEAPGSSFEAPTPANRIIDVPQTKGIKFCAKTGNQIYAYDSADNTVKLRDVIYKFAVTFPIPVPQPLENLEVFDAPKAENSVVLVWDKGKESNIKSYSIYYSKNDFVNVKMDDIKKDNNVLKKTVLNEPVEIKDIDLSNCIISPVGMPCKYSIYNNHLEKDKLYIWSSKDKLIYLLSDNTNLKDGTEYNFAVTAVNEVNKELDNDKSIKGNAYVFTQNKNYKKSMPIDDLAPNSDKIVLLRQPTYEPSSKKVTFNFGELPKTNADGSLIKDFKNYKVYYAKYPSLSQKQKAEAVTSIINNELNKLQFIQEANYGQEGHPFFADLASTNPQSNNVYFFVIVASDDRGNPKEDKYRIIELGAVPLQLEIQ